VSFHECTKEEEEEEEEEEKSYTAKDPHWSFSIPPCIHSQLINQYNACENDACALA
jgi:hypothetical protein